MRAPPEEEAVALVAAGVEVQKVRFLFIPRDKLSDVWNQVVEVVAAAVVAEEAPKGAVAAEVQLVAVAVAAKAAVAAARRQAEVQVVPQVEEAQVVPKDEAEPVIKVGFSFARESLHASDVLSLARKWRVLRWIHFSRQFIFWPRC